jgi:hypothetical protein
MCGVGLFCTFQDGICVVWVCFVPFVLFASLLVYKRNNTVPVSHPKTGRKLYCVPIIADHTWNCFVLLKLFLYQPHPLSHIVLLTDFFRTVYVWCGIVLYLSGRYLCGVGLFCTICTVCKSIGIQMEPHSTFFTTKNGSKIVLCANNCRPQMELFCTIETFFVPQSDSIAHFMFQGSFFIPAGTKKVSLVRNPLESFESSEKLGG